LIDLVGYDGNSRGGKLYIIDFTHFLLYAETLIPLAYKEITGFSMERPRLWVSLSVQTHHCGHEEWI
jgi:hypothetical protein